MLNLGRACADVVVHHCVASRRSHALLGGGRHEVELVDVLVSDARVHNHAWYGVLEALLVSCKEAGVYSLADINVHELSLQVESGKGSLDLVNFGSADAGHLALTNAVPVENDPLWVASIVGLTEGLQGLGHTLIEGVRGFLSNLTLDHTGGEVLRGRVVD